MNEKPNLSTILDRVPSPDDKPKPLPVGEYIFFIKGLPNFGKSTKKQTDFVEFNCEPIQALTVDEDDLQYALTRGDGTVKPLSSAMRRLTFYITDEAVWRLDSFMLNALRIEPQEDDEDKTRNQLIQETPGRTFIGTISHVTSEDGTQLYANISSWAPVKD